MSALLPCPFCGASAFANEYYRRPFPGVSDATEWRWEVVCRGDDEHHSDSHATEAEAIAAWNRRTPDARVAELEAEVARLRGVLLQAIEEMDANALVHTADRLRATRAGKVMP